MRILIAEDDPDIADSLKKGLEQESFAVDLVSTGVDAFDLATTESYDCIILDWMLPQVSGIEVCRKLRAEKKHTPILILTAKSQLENKVEGFNSGADDYLVKPFAFAELLVRIKALMRRPKEAQEDTLNIGDLSLNTQTYEVKREGKTIALSQKEYALLEYLMRHPNKTLNKEDIISHVWNYDADIVPNTLETYIGYLRNKIEKPFNNKPLIHTVRGFGYKIGEKP